MGYYRTGDFYRARGDFFGTLKSIGSVVASAALGPIGLGAAATGILGSTAQKYAGMTFAGAQGFLTGGPLGALQAALPAAGGLFSTTTPPAQETAAIGSPLSPENYAPARRARGAGRRRGRRLRQVAEESNALLTTTTPPILSPQIEAALATTLPKPDAPFMPPPIALPNEAVGYNGMVFTPSMLETMRSKF